jgi:hypothetical protein
VYGNKTFGDKKKTAGAFRLRQTLELSILKLGPLSGKWPDRGRIPHPRIYGLYGMHFGD